MLKLNRLTSLVTRGFGRLQRKGDGVKKEKESTRGAAAGDEKFIKLSKKEDDTEKVKKEVLERQKRLDNAKKHDISLDQRLSPSIVENCHNFIQMNQIDLIQNPLQTFDVLQQMMKDSVSQKAKEVMELDKKNREKFEKISVTDWEGQYYRGLRKSREFMNAERFVNEKFTVAPVKPSSKASRRCGSMGYKMGMTSIFDKWGHMIPLTVLQLDRCQVLRIKEKEKDGVDSILVGCGERALKSMKKPEIGMFLKAGVPPKQDIGEFRISPENKLPVGYMIGVRHFTVGQFVDVQSKSKGKGFSGVMKRWNFNGLPASHGVSLTHRTQGSTGQRQDPGRVWKKLKMAGRLGFESTVIRRLQVYKIDADRSLLYVKGSVAGPIGRHVKVFDSLFHWKDNWGLLNYPTFIFEKDRPYASVLQVEPPASDPTEDWLHENAVLPDDEEEIAALSDLGDEGQSAKPN